MKDKRWLGYGDRKFSNMAGAAGHILYDETIMEESDSDDQIISGESSGSDE
jgi:hypothetical protein